MSAVVLACEVCGGPTVGAVGEACEGCDEALLLRLERMVATVGLPDGAEARHTTAAVYRYRQTVTFCVVVLEPDNINVIDARDRSLSMSDARAMTDDDVHKLVLGLVAKLDGVGVSPTRRKVVGP